MARDSKSGLSPALVELAKKGKLIAGKYQDRDGLVLKVDGPNSARWVLRVTVNGKRRDLGLGSVQHVGLAEAREKTMAKRSEARHGKDPEKVTPLSFKEAAQAVYDFHKGGWRGDGKHVDQWWTSMETHILPQLGNKLVGDITPGDMLDALTPVWLTIPETARRLKQRCALIFNWATTKNHRSAQLPNPADVCAAALPRQEDEPRHHPAVQWKQAPEFLTAARNSKGKEGTRLALEFLLLTASRTSETLYAEWSEFDIDGRTWTVPAGRMKRKKAHRVALSDQALAVLETARARWPNSKLVFNGRYPGEALSNQALLMLMRRLGFKDDSGDTAVPHGCRSTFKDWCTDNGEDDTASELALAHAVGSATKRSYRRTDLLDPRRLVMQRWADFVTGKSTVEPEPKEADPVAEAA